MKPIEANILYNISGTEIMLITKEEYSMLFGKLYRYQFFFESYNRMPKLKELVCLLFVKPKRTINRKLL